MSNIIAISSDTDEDGKFIDIIHHARGNAGSDYATLCGMDKDDPDIGQVEMPVTRKTINCHQCYQCWEDCTIFKRSDFRV